MRFTTRLVRALPVGSGTYKVLICTDIYSQIQRFAQNTNCSPGAGLAISTRQPSEAVRAGAEDDHQDGPRECQQKLDRGFSLRFDGCS